MRASQIHQTFLTGSTFFANRLYIRFIRAQADPYWDFQQFRDFPSVLTFKTDIPGEILNLPITENRHKRTFAKHLLEFCQNF